MRDRALSVWGEHYGGTKEALLTPLAGGLINRTWLVVDRGARAVLQWVNPLFPPETNDDVARVTEWIGHKGLAGTRLIPALSGQSCVIDRHLPDGGSWRVLSFVDGAMPTKTLHIRDAAAYLAEFHGALIDFPYEFKHRRDIHNTRAHMASLVQAIEENADHPWHSRVATLAEQVAHQIGDLIPSETLIPRVVHGDPKLENFLLTTAGPVLIDLDTVGKHTLFGELGDAVRSWCNDRGLFSLPLYTEFFRAYGRSRSFEIEHGERESVGHAHVCIALELASRFLADSLNESYFSWDSVRFPSAAAHNFERAQIQLRFAQSALAHLHKTRKIASSL